MQILLLLRNVDGVGPTLTFSLPSEGGKMLFGVFVPRDISQLLLRKTIFCITLNF